MIYLNKGKKNNVVTDWYSTEQPEQLEVYIDGKLVENVTPLYENPLIKVEIDIPSTIEVGEWLLNWGNLKSEIITVIGDSPIITKNYKKEIKHKQYGNY